LQLHAAYNMEVAVALALQSVAAEVRQYPEAIGSEGNAQFDGDVSHSRQQCIFSVWPVSHESIAPQVSLA